MPISEHQPPPIRQDLEIVPQYYRGELSYLAKDPVTLSYYKLGEVEYIVLKCFQEGMGLEQTQQEVRARTGVELPPLEIYRFAEQLRHSNLLKSKGMEDVGRLARNKRKQRRQKIKQTVSNYLFVTIPLWDPDRVLNKLLPLFRAIVTPLFWLAWLILTSIAVWIIGTNFWTLVDDAFSMLSAENLLILSIVVFSVKFVHEMGHALTCKNFGGEVHAIGPAFLIFQPCMYTDTTDAWLFPNKWHRVLVTASGIIIEIMLASVAAIWWITAEPGLGKQVAYTTMVVCSISTILFNANPLLRFDGYYVLSDLVEIPNLRVKTNQYLNYLFDRYLLGLEKDPPPMERDSRPIFLIYGIARFLYRMVLIVSIGFLLYAIFPPLGVFMWVTSLYGMVLGPTWRRGQELTRQYRSGKVQVRYIGIIALVIAVVAGLFLMPIDYVIQAPCAVMPARTSTVRTAVSGRIVRVHSHPGQAVKAGEALFEMENPELELDLERMEKRLELAREQRRAAQAAHDLAARQRYDNEVRKVREEVRELEDHVARLVVKAPHDGIVVSLNRRDVHGTPTQHGFVTPLQGVVTVEPQDFVGTVVSPGTGVMAVADQETVRLDMFVPEYDRGFVRVAEETEEASPVQVLLRSLPDALIETVAATRAETDVKTIQNVGLTLADVGWLPVERGPNGELTPQRKLYLVRSALLERAALPGRVALGTTGKANIIYGRGPAGTFYARRIWRNLRMRMQAATGQ